MKRTISLFLFSILFLSGCQFTADENRIGSIEIEEMQQLEEYQIMVPMNGYIALANYADNLILGEVGVTNTFGTERYDTTLTELSVIDRLDSDYDGTLESGDEIIIQEPYWITENGMYETETPYIPLEEGERYIFFLLHIEENEYAIIGGRYGVFHENREAVYWSEEFVTVQDLWNYSFVTHAQPHYLVREEMRVYTEIRQEVQERYFTENEIEQDETEGVALEGVEIFEDGVESDEQPIPDSLEILQDEASYIVTAQVLRVELPGHYIGLVSGVNPTRVRIEVVESHRGSYQEGQRVTILDNWWMHWVYSDVEHLNIERGAVPLEPGEEYIFFLDDPFDEPHTVNFGYGIYHENMDGIMENQLSLNAYEDIQGYTFIAASEEAYEQYQTIRQEVLDIYGRQRE